MSSEPTTNADEQPAGEGIADNTDAVAPGEDEEPEPVVVEPGPPRLSQLISVGAILLGVVLTVPFAFLAIPFGLAGSVLFVASLFRVYSRSWLTVGTALVLFGALITGAYGALQPELMLLAVGSIVLAWDVGQHGISIGQQLGRSTTSHRLELVHTAISAFVIGFVSLLGYVVFLLVGDGRPAPAVALIIFGVVLFAWLYRS